jgi:hypothetical protein
MHNIIRNYLKLPKPVLYVIVSEFFLQLINTSFLSIQVIFMQKNGYADYQSAGFIAYRFLGVILFAVPVGFYIRGKALRSFFLAASVLGPLFALMIIIATQQHLDFWLYIAQFMWGIAFMLNQVPILPYILRHTPKEQQTTAIALSYSTYSFAGIISGSLIFVLMKINPIFFTEGNLLFLIVLTTFVNSWFVLKLPTDKALTNNKIKNEYSMSSYNWKLIIKALIPTLIIAVGAGLTIPFIGIFFYNVHQLNTQTFGLLSGIAAILVAMGALLVPVIKEKIGFKIAIPVTQSFAVLSLALLATTQFYAHLNIAVVIASICFLIRQPLMNMAGPMTTDVVMNYVGKNNREMVSALTSAIWSGSWFISGLIFKHLRKIGIDYVYVFLITVLLYGFGVIWYYYLIIDYNKRLQAGLIE